MATKAEIQNIIKNRLLDYYKEDITGLYTKTALAGAISDPEFDSIAEWLRLQDFAKVGRFIGSKVMVKIRADADAEAAAMLANDSLDLTELSRVLRL